MKNILFKKMKNVSLYTNSLFLLSSSSCVTVPRPELFIYEVAVAHRHLGSGENDEMLGILTIRKQGLSE